MPGLEPMISTMAIQEVSSSRLLLELSLERRQHVLDQERLRLGRRVDAVALEPGTILRDRVRAGNGTSALPVVSAASPKESLNILVKAAP